MKISLILFVVLAVIILAGYFLSGCVFVPDKREPENDVQEEEGEIDMTYIDEAFFPPSDEWMTVPMEELPFHAQIPAWWSFTENVAEYILWFDDGLTGSIVFDKRPKAADLSELAPDGAVVMHNASSSMAIFCYENSCTVQVSGVPELYGFVISDKGFSATQNAEVWEIVKRLEVD